MHEQRPELPAFEVPEITRDRMLEVMDVMGDVNPIHSDEALVKRLGLRGLVNQGPANMAYVVNMLVRWAANPAAIRRLRFRFHVNVVPGDRPVARGRIVAARRDPARGEELVDCEFWLELADGTRALSGTATLARPAADRLPRG